MKDATVTMEFFVDGTRTWWKVTNNAGATTMTAKIEVAMRVFEEECAYQQLWWNQSAVPQQAEEEYDDRPWGEQQSQIDYLERER